jgi:hypothetical protein
MKYWLSGWFMSWSTTLGGGHQGSWTCGWWSQAPLSMQVKVFPICVKVNKSVSVSVSGAVGEWCPPHSVTSLRVMGDGQEGEGNKIPSSLFRIGCHCALGCHFSHVCKDTFPPLPSQVLLLNLNQCATTLPHPPAYPFPPFITKFTA